MISEKRKHFIFRAGLDRANRVDPARQIRFLAQRPWDALTELTQVARSGGRLESGHRGKVRAEVTQITPFQIRYLSPERDWPARRQKMRGAITPASGSLQAS
jgi:hypothetical protein